MKLNPKENKLRNSIHVENEETIFCALWPQTKKALDLLKVLENNPAADLILTTVKAAGDAIVRKANN